LAGIFPIRRRKSRAGLSTQSHLKVSRTERLRDRCTPVGHWKRPRRLAAAISKRFPDVEILGLELSKSGVKISERKVPAARFLQTNLLQESSPPKEVRLWATHAVCSEVIEHVDDPLRSAGDYILPGCRLVVAAPGGPMSAFDKYIGHRKHFGERDLEPLLRESGYLPEYVGRAGFPFFNLYRCVVILRGNNLVHDVSTREDGIHSLVARIGMGLFRCRFRLNLGGQPVGVADGGEGTNRRSN